MNEPADTNSQAPKLRDIVYPRSGGTEPAPPPCRMLRTKTMYYAFDREAALEVGPECNTRPYWCVETGSPLGPDSEPVNDEACRNGRDCWKT